MQIRTRLSMSADGYASTPDGWPALLADPSFVSSASHGFPEFQRRCEAVLMGRTSSSRRWPTTAGRGPTWTCSCSAHTCPPTEPARRSSPTLTPRGCLTGCGRLTGAVTCTSSADRARPRRFDEARGLLALMLLTRIRRDATHRPPRRAVALAEQDRRRWDRSHRQGGGTGGAGAVTRPGRRRPAAGGDRRRSRRLRALHGPTGGRQALSPSCSSASLPTPSSP